MIVSREFRFRCDIVRLAALAGFAVLAARGDVIAWPENYWSQSVTNLVSAATPSGTAAANATVAISAPVREKTASPAYASEVEARSTTSSRSDNSVANFVSFPPGVLITFR